MYAESPKSPKSGAKILRDLKIAKQFNSNVSGFETANKSSAANSLTDELYDNSHDASLLQEF